MVSGTVGAGMPPPDQKSGPRNISRIDAYSHWSSLTILGILEAAVPIPGYKHPFRALFANNPQLINVDARLELMEKMQIDHHVLAPLPWIETIPTPFITKEVSLAAAQALNNEMAAMVSAYPGKFSAVALLPLLDKEDMLMEFERCVTQLGMVGGFYVSAYPIKPPDHLDFFNPASDDTLYGKAAALDVPLWLHPAKPAIYGDYTGEDAPPLGSGPGSKYNIYQALSWLLDSSAAMVRIVFAGVFEKYPDLKIIIHHHGALIPLFAERLVYGWEFFEKNAGAVIQTPIDKPYIDHFKKFYCDTATQGYAPDHLKRAIKFFGIERVLFGTDAPMDATGGEVFTDTARRSVESLRLPKPYAQKIFNGNIKRLINRP
jgi:predicted TIM-barrel fold metal-dependent hydrolase